MPKIRIKQSPTGPAMFPDNLGAIPNPFATNGTLQPVPREQANIEAERGETALGDFDRDGKLEHMQIGGLPHTEGGTPLNVPDNTFIYSDTKNMRLKGDLVKFFGKNPDNKKGFTPAEMAKQYDMNKYKAILDDPNADPISKRTAELMTNNYQEKLGQLAFVQEAHKGFPNGIPDVAMEFAQSVMPHNPMMSDKPAQGYAPSGQPQFAFGGDYDPGVDPYAGGKTTTPTGKSNKFSRDQSYIQQWEKMIPGISALPNSEAQGKMYDWMLKNNPDQVRNMWQDYGLTNQGKQNKFLYGLTDKGRFKDGVLNNVDNLQQLRSAYTDGMFGARQFDPNNVQPPADYSLDNVHIDPINLGSGTPAAKVSVPSITYPGMTPGDPGSFTKDKGNYNELTPDRWSQEEAGVKASRLKKYLPYIATPDITTANPTFYDPTRELAAGEESQNAQLMFDAQYGNPQTSRAMASSIAGQGAANAANVIGKYDNMNVSAANQFSEQEAQNMNNYSMLKAKNDTDLYNGNVIANQQYDNARNMSDDDILKGNINAWNNRSQFEAMNKTNKMYQIDPETGHMVFTPTGKDIFGGAGHQQQQGFSKDQYTSLLNTINTLNPGLSADEKHKWVMQQMEGERETQTYKGNNPMAATTKVSGYQYPAFFGQ